MSAYKRIAKTSYWSLTQIHRSLERVKRTSPPVNFFPSNSSVWPWEKQDTWWQVYKKKKIVYIKRGCGFLLFGDLTMTKWKDHIKYHPNGHWKDNTWWILWISQPDLSVKNMENQRFYFIKDTIKQ